VSASQPPALPRRNPGPPPPIPPQPADSARPAAPPPQQYPGGPQYAPPPGYAGAPYVAPYAAPRHPQFAAAVTPTETPRGPWLGIVALLAALAAAIIAPIVGAVAGFRIGMGAGTAIAMRPVDAPWDWRVLTPVRDWVLMGEMSFWLGTALGVWAIVQGVIAIIKARGRGAGIAAVIIAILGFFAFVFAVWFTVLAGFASGSSIGG
jgi:hypothetical protein